jgi:hypothetical protein
MNIARTTRPNISSIPDECVPTFCARAADGATVDIVADAVPVPCSTEILPITHVGAGLTAGARLQVNITPAELNPFDGAIVMVEVADWPGETEDGERVEAERMKSAATLTTLDVLALKLLSPS